MTDRPLAVITGASSGIGAESARRELARGHDLLLIARRQDRLQALAEELGKAHGAASEILVADLTLDEDRARAAARITTAKNLALMVNNAGFGTQGAFENADLNSQDQMHRLNILTTLDLTHAALRNFKERGENGPLRRGIINVSSVAGFGQAPFNVGYCATKAWNNSFTKGLSIELAAEPISTTSPVRVQALCPGYTHSEFHDHLGMDRRTIPGWLWMSAKFVVTESLHGFDRGTLFVIPGWHYRWIVRLIRMTPGSWMRWISILFARKRRERAEAFARKP
jgi:hypothetical protein